MNIARREKIVVLGMMSKIPVAGVIWQTVHYLLGFRRLGFDVYYVEAHCMPPTNLMVGDDKDGSVAAATLIRSVLERFDLGNSWAFHALHSDGACYGMSLSQLQQLYQSAALIINLHGATVTLPEHAATQRLVYLETDPVAIQIEVHQQLQHTIDYLAPHIAFYTFGENYGRPGCRLPVSTRFPFKPTRQPIILDLWEPHGQGPAELLTTIGNWRQSGMGKEVSLNGEVFQWSKHFEFLKFIELPRRTEQRFELALSSSSYSPADKKLLESKGWQVCDALEFSKDMDDYRRYIGNSRGEFTVAKEQNIRLRTGWFSDRAATYLAAGRPVITQETAFSQILPTGEGLFAFSTMDEILAAVDAINADYERQRRAALRVARECFSYDVVLPPLLADLGISPGARASRSQRSASPPNTSGEWNHENSLDDRASSLLAQPTGGVGRREVGAQKGYPAPSETPAPAPEPVRLPYNLALLPSSRLPLRLPDETVRTALALPPPVAVEAVAASGPARRSGAVKPPQASIIMVTYNGLAYTKMCLTCLLAGWNPDDELILVDNGSTDGTPEWLREVMRLNPFVRVVFNSENRGFAAANNQGIRLATGKVLILLNNDTLAPRGWRDGLLRWLDDPQIGMVGPVTNRICNEAQIDAPYRTYGEMELFAQEYTSRRLGVGADIRMLAMYCVALRREVFEQIGPLDEQFGVGMFEDEDYSLQVRQAGYRIVCAEDVFVHHFSQASFGELCVSGEFDRLMESNRRRLEEKWGMKWEPHSRRISPEYELIRRRLQELVAARLPPGSTVMVVSKGDEELLKLPGHRAWHFPQNCDGAYPHIYPADSAEAITHLESLKQRGGNFLVIPKPGLWWLDHYSDFRNHLKRHYRLAAQDDETCWIFDLRPAADERPTLGAETPAAVNARSVPHPVKSSVIIPAFNHEKLTEQCVKTVLQTVAREVEVIVVDDASTDHTPAMLQGFGGRVRVVRHHTNAGFAASCNDGAAAAQGDFLVFLNNDTIPQPGWLDALVRYAESNPQAAAVGAKLLYPNHTIQHAGVVICQDRYPRHLYAGFPADHPAVSRSRRFQIVTAACLLVRRPLFGALQGFDTSYRNGLEDVDFCLRLGEAGHEVHYCADCVVHHLESVSPGRLKHESHNVALYRQRWIERVRPDDLQYYLEDGLMRFVYEGRYPVNLTVSPLLAALDGQEQLAHLSRLLQKRGREVDALLRDNTRLCLELSRRAPDSEELRYQGMRWRIAEAARRCVPTGSTVAVISKGDSSLLDLPGCDGWHFPQTEHGTYAGHHPADSAEAIGRLEAVRAKGAQYLLIPATSFWWLQHYADFARHLKSNFPEIVGSEDHCRIYALGGGGTGRPHDRVSAP